ncbi:MAG: AAA family ATPase [Methanosarcinales archaeon]
MLSGTIYLFLDEVQHMPQWNLWLKTIYDQKEKFGDT